MTNSIRAEVVTIGDEILFGQITDTNTQWIGTELTNIGIRVIRKSSVGDQAENILQVLSEAHQRADIIILTGGLGPTKDDITKKTLCTYFGVGMVRNETALALVTSFFAKRGREMTDLNRAQADLPANAVYMQNDWGTAPGMWIEHQGRVYVSLPGVPFEMKNLMTHRILPALTNHFATPVIKHKMILTVGIGESFLAERIADWEDSLPPHIKLAYLPSFGGVRLRLTATGTDEAALDQELVDQTAKVLPLIEKNVYGYDDDTLENVVGQLLKARGWTLSTAESCTGGYVAARITSVPGSSVSFMGSVVSYSNDVKINQLGVSPETLEQFGAVSEEVVRQMAEGVRKALNTDVAIATSGIAGPDGGTADKPVGTVWIACASPTRTVAKLLKLGQYRDQNIQLTATYVLNLLREEILL
ncbi:competence/damage-inducible protein A [Spirosoma sp. KUDC1026]|uniref:competence/damage-inducible protein A n=1 Tax=Spirosoma sp. KUDC1026 TaxID=2745947 RepID=UPI00159BCBAD|nr:competence/damage-inducible protein A [Spirosoma sp. KUDC1026]QKZ13081.1 competence/damage-inducible protein A [Spirosoma sp. KUDC1026]